MKKLFTTLSVLLIAAATMAQVPSYVPTNGILGWWPFDGNTNDASGNGNNGTGNNIVYDLDRMGNPNQSLFLTGVNNTSNGTYVTVDGADFNLTNDMSFSVWFKSTNGGINPMIEKKQNEGYAIYTASGNPNPVGHHSLAFNDQGTPWTTFDQYKVGTFSSIDDDWHHLVVTVSLNPGVVTMYLDGVLDLQGGLNTGGNASNSEDLQFGLWYRGGGNKFFNGNLDDIGIWSRAITPCEIQSLYTGQTLTPPTATITPNSSTTICSGGFVQLTASAGDSYLWSNGETTQTITATQADAYTVTVTNNDGCTDTSDPVTVTVNPTPNSGVTVGGATTFCSGDSVTLTSQASSGSYLWSNGETTQSITVDQTGNYSVTVTENGCSATSGTTAVTVNQTPTATITPQGSTTFCDGGFVVLDASGGGTYQWNTGSQSSSINVSQSGTYSVIVTDNGCTGQTSQLVTVNPLPTVTLAPFSSLCENGAVVQLSGGSPSGGYYTVNGNPTPELNPITYGVGTHTIEYVYADSNSCVNTSSPQPITINAMPSVSMSGLNTSYTLTDPFSTLTGTPTGGVFNGTGMVANYFDPSEAGLGTHGIAYIYVDGNGCIGSDAQCTTVDLNVNIGGSNIGTDVGTIDVYPNPSNGLFSVSVDGIDGIINMIVYDSRGREIINEAMVLNGQKSINDIDLNNYSDGVYTLSIRTGKGTTTQKLVKE
ncbi:T9SS type A sorting domain-containing protein [Flavobacteriales bacterium]|nr:T9SS type A sorting domain-containing protein [Flavobacteriales bacterium]